MKNVKFSVGFLSDSGKLDKERRKMSGRNSTGENHETKEKIEEFHMLECRGGRISPHGQSVEPDQKPGKKEFPFAAEK